MLKVSLKTTLKSQSVPASQALQTLGQTHFSKRPTEVPWDASKLQKSPKTLAWDALRLKPPLPAGEQTSYRDP